MWASFQQILPIEDTLSRLNAPIYFTKYVSETSNTTYSKRKEVSPQVNLPPQDTQLHSHHTLELQLWSHALPPYSEYPASFIPASFIPPLQSIPQIQKRGFGGVLAVFKSIKLRKNAKVLETPPFTSLPFPTLRLSFICVTAAALMTRCATFFPALKDKTTDNPVEVQQIRWESGIDKHNTDSSANNTHLSEASDSNLVAPLQNHVHKFSFTGLSFDNFISQLVTINNFKEIILWLPWG